MKVSTALLLALLFLASGPSSLARVTKKTYSGTYKGLPCTVQLNWQNWKGLGAIDGVIRVSDGTIIPFSGSNSQFGVIEFQATGESFQLIRRDEGDTTSWIGKKLSFTESAPAPTPKPKNSPPPAAATRTSTPGITGRLVDESYTGTWRGKEFTARLRWAPGDEPGIIRRGRGTLTLAGGQQFSIEGWQPGAALTEFRISPDETKETYKTSKADRNGNVSWESSSLTLTETK